MTPEQINQWRHRIRAHTYANYHYEMARALADKTETVAACQHLRQALDIMPQHAVSSLLLMDILRSEGREADVQAVRQEALAAGVFDTVERLRAGVQVLASPQPAPPPAIPDDAPAGALQALETMYEVAALLRQQEPAYRHSRKEVATDLFLDSAQWGDLFSKALPAYLSAGRWADAIRLGTIGDAIAPGTPRLEHSLALAHLATGDVVQALAILEPAVAASPYEPFLSIDLALALGHKGDAAAAIEAAGKAAAMGARKPIAYSMLAWNGLLFDDQDALDVALPVLRSRKEDISPWTEFPLALAALRQGSDAEALELLRGLFAQPKLHAPSRLCFTVLPGREQREHLLPLMLATGYEPGFPPLTPA